MLNKVKSRSFSGILTIPPPSYLSKLNLLKLVLLILLLSLPSSTNLFGQVVIKERVKIEPKVTDVKTISKDESTSHYFKLSVDSLDGEHYNYRFKIKKCDGDSLFSNYLYSGSHLEYNFTVDNAGNYLISLLRYYKQNPSDQGMWTPDFFEIYADGKPCYDEASGSVLIAPWFAELDIEILENEITYDTYLDVEVTGSRGCTQIIGLFNSDFPIVSIEVGQKYLSFYNSFTLDVIGDYYNAKENYNNNIVPLLKYDIPYYKDEELKAILKSELNGVIAYDTVTVSKMDSELEEIILTIIPNSLFQNEEASISLQRIMADGSIANFPEEQLFDVEIIEGAEYGTIVSSSETADTLLQIEQGFSFVADSYIYKDAEVLIKVSTDVGGLSISSRKGKDIIAPAGGGFGETIYGIGKIIGGEEILLGETKYFGLKKKDEDGEEKYEIAVTDITYGEMPTWPTLSDGWSWVKNSNVWGTNPIKKLGTKSGVYWEKKWYDKTDNKNKDIPNGMIRVIGRYWESGKENDFKVKLKATDKADIVVKVVRPGKLLTEGESPSYSKTRDVFDKVVNIDSLCIYYGGLNGISPQFLKGHIAKESAKKNFGGEVGWGFAPSYRYEPYTAQMWRDLHKKYSDNPFYITSSTNIEPPEHQHVEIIPYFSGDTVTVWQIVKEHSQLVEDGSTPETKMYGTRTHADTMNYAGYPAIKRKYHEFLTETKKLLSIDENGDEIRLSLSEKADSANKRMIRYLRDEFIGGIGTIGMKNMIAQTRIASSYGYFQPIYTTAILPTWGYEEDEEHPPENLNRNDVVFPLSVNRYNSFLSSYLENEEDNNWGLGFETAVKEHILGNWNTHKAYPNSTINNMERFLPQK